ncbi:hypothetical protein RHMOL_Rhmol10G0073500 [Rhododendron molle]|uniref:Uncharacterized protein n=1 Tax=Rhododendron molle TaxID=49168 RepID=A0ACC0M071_RHOML|nr:hypothetical protein RHMOL_Rhmol10G0073500 [Rhododendron molle]
MDLNLNELRSPDLGPRDGSILRLQQQHRSREVWEADSVKNLPHISSDCEFIFHTGGYVHLANLERLENFDEAGTYSWGSGALANLYHNLCHSCKAGTKQITGCFILLQVWAWERLPYLAPGRLGKRAPKAGAPLIGQWDDVFHSPDLATHLVSAYRYHLDIQRPDETRCLKALNMPGVPAPYRDVGLAGLMHMGVFEKFLRLQPPQHGVFKGNQELGQQGEGLLEEELQPQQDANAHGHDQPHVEHPDDNIPIPPSPPPPPLPHESSFSPLPHFASFEMSPSIFDSPVVEPTGGGGSSSQTCSHSEVPWEQLEVVGFGASTFSDDGLVQQAKRRRIDESSLGDVGGSVGDGDITQLGLDTQDLLRNTRQR